MHLAGFIIRIYHDARSPERQISMCNFAVSTSFDNFRFMKTLRLLMCWLAKPSFNITQNIFLSPNNIENQASLPNRFVSNLQTCKFQLALITTTNQLMSWAVMSVRKPHPHTLMAGLTCSPLQTFHIYCTTRNLAKSCHMWPHFCKSLTFICDLSTYAITEASALL